MAIGVAIPKYVSRSSGGNACCKSAYNARSKILNNNTGEIFNWTKRGGNVFHEILLPDYVNKKFSDVSEFSNEVEKTEKKCNSQLYVEWLVPLAKEDDGVDLEFRIETAKEFVKRKGWVKEGLGVQIDIHKPHEGNVNWHAHVLVTTRRFTLDGKELGEKARDMQPINRRGVVQNRHELNDNILLRDIQNEQFKARGMSNRVDLPGVITQEHVGPIRMRSLFNQVSDRNEERKIAEVEYLDSGKRVLEKITNHLSIFTEADIKRAVKFLPDESKGELVRQVLLDKSLEELFDEKGESSGYYTTTEVREEEIKLKRLSNYVSRQSNIFSVLSKTKDFIESTKESLTEEQYIALSHLLLEKSGIRIMRGRAGTGKSHVLGNVSGICKNLGVNVIGLTTTHKAKSELVKCGFNQVDTIKGMLFKIHNGKFVIEKNSLFVVDEAGMIGNDDYTELLRVASKYKCNVILTGDERQLSSVQRGGMFEVFAEVHGASCLFDIQRQDSKWGKAVAKSFSNGEVRVGIDILKQNNKIITSNNKISSMEKLLFDWNQSSEPLENKIILSIKNSDVDYLNEGVREYLKSSGYLDGREVAIGSRCYMKGDRILIQETNKELNLNNGDLCEITYVSKERFIINANGKEISFSPSDYHGFKHGYASTVFKAQGISINEVFVLHNGFSTMRNSYVALSRNIKDVKLYTNNESTKNYEHLIKQLSNDKEKSSSLVYCISEDIEKNQRQLDFDKNKGIFGSLIVGAMEYGLKKVKEVTDKNIALSGYYDYEKMELKKEKVEEVLDKFTGSNKKISAKDRFYQKVDKKIDLDRLRFEVKFKSEQIAKDLLGEPNRKLSDGRTLRYGTQGKLAIRISGECQGTWYDFSLSKGGDIFSLVRENQGSDFKGAVDYLSKYTGISINDNNHILESKIKEKCKQEKLQEQKQNQVNKLVQRSKEITDRSVAFRYLSNRGIYCNLSDSVKTTGIYVKEKNRYSPALIVFAKDKNGNITGGQQVILAINGMKENIEVPKRSFGKISGSFVNLGGSDSEITIIAEGLETALSVKQVLNNDSKILCSLGIGNISNYEPRKGENILIAADNDGEGAITNEVINVAKVTLEEKGAFVEIVKSTKGDFNDMLIAGKESEIRNMFIAEIDKCKKNGLDYNLANFIQKNTKLTEKEKIDFSERLNMLSKQSISLGLFSERDIVQELKENSDIKKVCEKVEGVIEVHQVNDRLLKLDSQKHKENTPEKILSILKEQEKFLASLHNNLKYPDLHGQKLIKSIENASKNEKTNIFKQLEKIVTVHIAKSSINSNDISQILKTKPSCNEALFSLTKYYQNFVVKDLQRCLNGINAGKVVKIDNKRFNSPIKFLERILEKHKDNEFLPREKIENKINNLVKTEKEISLSKEMEI